MGVAIGSFARALAVLTRLSKCSLCRTEFFNTPTQKPLWSLLPDAITELCVSQLVRFTNRTWMTFTPFAELLTNVRRM